MKNFNELKKELKIEKEDAKNNVYEYDLGSIILSQTMIMGELSAIKQLLIRMAIASNLEIKDDDGNVISVQDYVNFVDENMSFGHANLLSNK